VRPALTLRTKIQLITVVPLVALALATLWTVHRTVMQQANARVRGDLQRASAVLENLLAVRARSLEAAGGVVVRDPRFFSVLTLPGPSVDPQIRATVAGVASDFNSVTHSDLFEVYGHDGTRLAVAGERAARREAVAPLVTRALAGKTVSGVVADEKTHAQVCVTPVRAGGRVVGALLLGADMGRELADQLRDLTKSEVTFLSGARARGTTIAPSTERDALIGSLPLARAAHGRVFEIHAPDHVYMALARTIPGTDPAAEQRYVMERALDVETAWLGEIRRHLALIGAGAMLLALAAGLLIATRITAPMRILVRGAEEMERGNYAYPLDIRTRDEIGYLAERFRDMRRHQQLYIGSLQEVARLRSEFISIASHELRTPITIIRGYQELMEQEVLGPLSPQQRHAITGIGRSLGTLTAIAEDATRLSMIENDQLQLRLEEADLPALLAEAVRTAAAAAGGRSVTIENRCPANLGIAYVDGGRLMQAVTNLLRNGIRFTPDGGRVTLDATRENEVLVITISDTGVGISEARRAQIEHGAIAQVATHHHSSDTLEFNSAGLGMGLSIARGVVGAHGGTLRIESEVERGTTITIRIPLDSATLTRAA
jgi:signal transduction histidine kinase